MLKNSLASSPSVISKKSLDLNEINRDYRKRLAGYIDMIGAIELAAIVKMTDQNRWMMILPDVSGGDFWRTQSFDLDGFSGHSVHNSKDEAIKNAAAMHYIIRDDKALDRIQDTPEFLYGGFRIEQIGLLNDRQIDFKEFNSRIEKYRDQHLVAAVN